MQWDHKVGWAIVREGRGGYYKGLVRGMWCVLQSREKAGVEECCQEVQTSLDTVAELLGQLLLLREVQRRLVHSTTTSQQDTAMEEELHHLKWPTYEVCLARSLHVHVSCMWCTCVVHVVHMCHACGVHVVHVSYMWCTYSVQV